MDQDSKFLQEERVHCDVNALLREAAEKYEVETGRNIDTLSIQRMAGVDGFVYGLHATGVIRHDARLAQQEGQNGAG